MDQSISTYEIVEFSNVEIITFSYLETLWSMLFIHILSTNIILEYNMNEVKF